ncbi:DeoR/GlpR family DNA-binding transcription regulator [Salinicola aestuarinus]|uniref:DeoR/GlpR family DNA-binding transcription regulator n=1 Tax=Salinicola aestuarinus TaxID=1949082 RepID=UPI000DA1C7FF|nr:DeoR/GlpR family DNA-binding transcription regulator [Salinicola aestuarinus]
MSARSAVRLEWLHDVLRRGGTLPLAEAARLCEVSEMTVRRDIAASRGAILSIGGHLILADHPQLGAAYDLASQQDRYAQAKTRLCERAATLIDEGDTLFVDCGTTLLTLCSLIPRIAQVTIVTYALNVANAVTQRAPEARLVVLGGLYFSASQSFGGQEVTAAIRRLGINKAFISAAGVHAEKGVSCFHFHEVAPKQAAIEHAERSILVADESKLDVRRAALFAELGEFDTILTTGNPGHAWRDRVASVEAERIQVV